MKKSLLFLSLISTTYFFAQCNIEGNNTAKVGEQVTYTVDNDTAQCTDCHLWVTTGGNSTVDGEFRKNNVTIKPNSIGRTILSLTMLTQNGVVQCVKNIDVVAGTNTIATSNSPETGSSITTKPNCDITVDNFKELKYERGIVTFIPSDTENNYKYIWIVSYKNETKESTSLIPKFSYSDTNPIVKVMLRIVSKKCIREFSKNYESSYWTFF